LNIRVQSKFIRELKSQRLSKLLTQKELALRMGTSRAYVGLMESRLPPKNPHVVIELARALELDSYNTNRLLASAGFLPLELDGEWPLLFQELLPEKHTSVTGNIRVLVPNKDHVTINGKH
jgi:transcriptional regulator with XRE-family HTH domain